MACASCEAYIGDLHNDPNKYLAWNKYPLRESNENKYRVRLFNLIIFLPS